MSKTPYFPALYREVDCSKCEIAAKCRNYGKSQRNRRDFSVLSGRCPRLPDKRGFVEKGERERYASVFPLVHAERGDEEEEDLELTLRLPGEKRNRRCIRRRADTGTTKQRMKTGTPRGLSCKSKGTGPKQIFFGI